MKTSELNNTAAAYTKTSVAVNGNFSFGQFKLHNTYNIHHSDHRTKAVILPAIVVEENYKQRQKSSYTNGVMVYNMTDIDKKNLQ